MLSPKRQPARTGTDIPTFTGNRGLAVEEPLIFEIGRPNTTGVDLEEPAQVASRLGSARQSY